jgi:tetrahedral aminopeptidase
METGSAMENSKDKNSHPSIGSEQIALLERLSNAFSVSGDEGEVRKIVLERVRAILENRPGEISVDSLGSVLASIPGDPNLENKLRVMIAAHMDEVGFMITGEDEKGIYRFDVVGGIDVRYLPGKPVVVGKDCLPGVIGAKPIHLSSPDERRNTLSLESLRIDTGPAGGKVNLGDRAAFATRFSHIGPSLRGKALDDRIGVATLIELIKNSPQNIDLLAAFTVQEEVGLRGAGVAAYAFDPDLAIALDSTPAYDLPDWEDMHTHREENSNYNTRLGAGPAIYIADSSTLSDPRLVRHFIEVGDRLGIPYQIRQPGGGGTDAGRIHLKRAGIPSISISVPGRYHHTPAAICRLTDWQNTLALMQAALESFPPDLLLTDRA